ncbi:hypothetical protein O181_114851 [Austropuccinia psidii MF-1]|uniref:Uncharacterized protein n=1 Tax=Austropuccinia psidii MF-1 TaxID=1389203 RepID=A0A9Q3PVP0_9BASI|nr:hypothetical protein [Austropuccinia psidii MF-1]
MGPMVIYGHFGFDRIWGQDWLRWAQWWFGTHLALGANGLLPLAPFGLIGLGQKGPKWPTDRRPWLTDCGPSLRPTDHRGCRGPKWRPKAI